MPEQTEPRVQITMTEDQLRLVMNALEDYFRMRQGRSDIDLLDELCLQGVPTDDSGKIPDFRFSRIRERRDRAIRKLKEALDLCLWYPEQRTTTADPDMENEIALLKAIKRWRKLHEPVGARRANQKRMPCTEWATEPPPDIKWVVDNTKGGT